MPVITAIRIEQPMQVNDDVFHLRIVDSALRIRPPCRLGLGVVWENANNIELGGIFEIETARINNTAAKDEVKKVRHQRRLAYRTCGR